MIPVYTLGKIKVLDDWRHESRNSLNTNVCNNVEHDNDMLVLIDNQLSGRSGDLYMASSSSGSSYATRVSRDIR
jgi:hypothetical protein